MHKNEEICFDGIKKKLEQNLVKRNISTSKYEGFQN